MSLIGNEKRREAKEPTEEGCVERKMEGKGEREEKTKTYNL